ncbi:MAG: pilus assembly protein [Pseudonocardiales bacterium]|nr:pilus assembly protein [Pseudonocardiales bacterium]
MRSSRIGDDERGSVAAELTLLMPALLVLLLFVVFCGRLAEAHLRLDDAAHQAARAATIARSPTQASTDAQAAAQNSLAQAGVNCRQLAVDTPLAGFQPGATLSVRLTCHLDAADLTLLSLPTTIEISAHADSVIDRWRGGRPLGSIR